MSIATVNAAFDDFDAWENEVANRRRSRPARGAEQRTAIARSMNLRRHRTREREA